MAFNGTKLIIFDEIGPITTRQNALCKLLKINNLTYRIVVTEFDAGYKKKHPEGCFKI